MVAELGPKITRGQKFKLTVLSHFGYGGAVGALYPVATSWIPGPAILKGVGYGLTVWGASYVGWLPAAGILRLATKHPVRRMALTIGSHLLFGIVLAQTHKEMEDRSST